MKKRVFIFILVISLSLFGCSTSSEIETLENKIVDLENQISEYEEKVSDYEVMVIDKENQIIEYEKKILDDDISQEKIIKHITLSIDLLEDYFDESVIDYENNSESILNLFYDDVGDLYLENWEKISYEKSFYEKNIKPFIEKDHNDINELIIKSFDSLGYYYNRLGCVAKNYEGITQNDVKHAYQEYQRIYLELTDEINKLSK